MARLHVLEVFRPLIKLFVAVLAAMGAFLTYLGLVNLLQCAYGFGLVRPLQLAVDFYRDSTNYFAELADYPLSHLMDFLHSVLELQIPYRQTWAELIVPLGFYSFAIARAVAKVHHRWRSAWALRSSFFLVSLTTSLAASNWDLTLDSAAPVSIITIGFALINLVAGIWHSALVVQRGKKLKVFALNFFLFPIGTLLIGAFVLLVGSGGGSLGNTLSTNLGYSLPSLVQIIMLLALMSLRDIFGGVLLALFLRAPNLSRWKQFVNSGATHQGGVTFVLLLAAVCTALLGVGIVGSKCKASHSTRLNPSVTLSNEAA